MTKYRVAKKWIFSREEVYEFARLTGDTNPMHLDANKARADGLSDLSVHGALQIARFTAFIGSGGFMSGSTCMTVSGEFRKPLYPEKDYLVVLTCREAIAGLGIFSAECTVTDDSNHCLAKLTCDFKIDRKLKQT